MPVTPDLQDDEFEITLLCPIGVCVAQHTYAFKKELRNNADTFKEVKANCFKQVERTHREGKHKPDGGGK